jgi:predicted ArsR family transcriptional regulator
MTPERQFMCNNDVLRFLADEQGRTLAEIATHFGVTLTAIRNRVIRLMQLQSVTRQRNDQRRRGRPQFLYYITPRGSAILKETAEEASPS